MAKRSLSLEAIETIDLATKQHFRSPYAKGDENWSLVEAAGVETPQGEVHLHWMNHRGRGNWRFSSRGTTVCGTVRCRIVTIIPHGGEHEVALIDTPDIMDVALAWLHRKGEQREKERLEQLERSKLARLGKTVETNSQ
jgi:hypothetical protein